MIEIRRFRPGEEAALWTVYYGSTRHVVAREYTAQQVARWAPKHPNMDQWRRRLESTRPFVAIVNGQLVGFAELDPGGFIDRFYCHQDFQRQGVGTALFEALQQEAENLHLASIFANVSTTARDFFLAKGFHIERETDDLICGEPARQYRMRKYLSGP